MMYGLLAAVAVVIAAAAGMGYMLYRQQRALGTLSERLTRLEETQRQQTKSLARRMDNYLTGSIQMGKDLHELREQVAPLPDKLLELQQRDPGSLSFMEAARLVGLGASAEDLQQACGLSHSEAELLQRIHGKSDSAG